MHVHLIGIGGTGMASLAGLLHESGCRVTGSDRALYPPTSTLLEEIGLEVYSGFDRKNLDPAPDLVVVGNAVSRGNPEAEELLDRRLPCTSMPGIIKTRFLEGRHSIVVAGTHGKTTTASLLAWVLHSAGRDPGFLIGGIPGNFNRSYAIGSGPAFVIEGDEYDTAFFDKGPKFMHYRPDTALIGTVEFDHADIYRDLEHVKTVYRWLTNIVPGRGLLVRHEDCDVTREVTSKALCRVEGYGTSSGIWRADRMVQGEDGITFRILRDGKPFGETRLALSGEHNVRNALAVVAASVEQGLSSTEICEGIASFLGVKRRLEVRGTEGGVLVLDDFAHHPTAIAATMQTVRAQYPGRRLWAVLEPRSWSMRRNVFQERLADAFEGADDVLIASVFGADALPEAERLDPEKLVKDLEAGGIHARFLPDAAAIISHLVEETSPGDVVLVMSNGGFDGIHAGLLQELSAGT